MPRQITHTSSPISSDYICGCCGGLIPFSSLSADRPPIYNPENCSCIEVSSHDFGGGTQLLQTEQSIYHYGTTAILYERRNVSGTYTTSDVSTKDPEGPEIELMRVMEVKDESGSTYLAVEPEVGRGAARYRELSYPMRRYILEEPEIELSYSQQTQQPFSENYNTRHGEQQPRNRILSQDLYIRPPSEGRGSGKTKSWESEASRASKGSSLEHWETSPADPVRGIGAWAGEGFVLVDITASYPMNMSGMTEALLGAEGR